MNQQELNVAMQETHARVTAAVARSVAQGQDAKEAFKAHANALRVQWPGVFHAYVRWLVVQTQPATSK